MSEDEKTEPVTLSEAEAEAARAKAEFDEAKAEAEEAKPDDGTLRQTTISDALVASEAAANAEAVYEAAKEKLKAARVASEAAWKAGYEAAKAQVGEVDQTGKLFTNKRKQERIFRREMGEPEFFLFNKDVSIIKIRTQDEEEEISRKAQIPKDQTPKYNPKHVLSPEFNGGTNYESGIQDLVDKAKLKLDRLLNDPNANLEEVELVKLELKKLDYLFENYNLGMNVFRTAKGGREKIKE
jgi:colicin import membrane protein